MIKKEFYRRDLDGFRAMAVTAVILNHLDHSLLPGGYLGVDMFFVLSGYLVTVSIRSNVEHRSDLMAFYMRRVIRLFPGILFVMLISLIIAYTVMLSDEFSLFGKNLYSSAGFFSNFVQMQGAGYFNVASQANPLLHLWSLSVEEQFYLFWPVMLLIATNFRHSQKIILVVALSGVLLAWRASEDSLNYFSPNFRFFEFALGGWLANYNNFRINDRPIKSHVILNDIAFATGVLLILLCMVLANQGDLFLFSLATSFGALLFIHFGSRSRASSVFQLKSVVFLGIISYPLYLVHWPIISFVMLLGGNPRIFCAEIIVGIFLLALFIYFFIERPINRWSDKGKASLALSIMMGLFLFAGLYIYSLDGMPNRTNNENRENFIGAIGGTCDVFVAVKQNGDLCSSNSSRSSSSDGAAVLSPRFLIIGDSIAGTYSSVIRELITNKNDGLTFVTLSRHGCPPALEYGSERCRELFDKVPDFVKNSKPDVVFLSAHWNAYLENEKYDFGDSVEPKGRFISGVEKIVTDILPYTKKIVILLAPPMGNSVRDCLRRPFSLAPVKDCSWPRDLSESLRPAQTQIFDILSPYKLAIFDPFDYLCGTYKCETQYNNKILYLDGAHLNIYGGSYLAHKARKELNQIMGFH